MDYPQEFSSQARARVEAERLKAGRDLEEIGKNPQSRPNRTRSQGPYGPLWSHAEEDLHAYILHVFGAFASEACGLGKQGTWTVDRIRSEAEQFLVRFTIEAHEDKCTPSFGGEYPIWNMRLRPKFRQEFEKSEEWGRFELELLAVAEWQAAQGPPRSRTVADERRAQVDAYIDEVFQKTGKTITRTAIWKKVGYKARTEFERWERDAPEANKTAHARFTAILTEKPHLK